MAPLPGQALAGLADRRVAMAGALRATAELVPVQHEQAVHLAGHHEQVRQRGRPERQPDRAA